MASLAIDEIPSQTQQEFTKYGWLKCTIHLHKLAAGKRSLSVWRQLCIVVCFVRWSALCEVNCWSIVCCGVVFFYGYYSLSQQVSGNVGIWVSLDLMSCLFCISLVFLKCLKMGRSAQVIPLDCFPPGTNGGDLSKYLKRAVTSSDGVFIIVSSLEKNHTTVDEVNIRLPCF